MNVKDLYIKDDDGSERVVALACGECGKVFNLSGAYSRDHAAKCCEPLMCEECGEETHYTGLCSRCLRSRRRKRILDEAEFVPHDEYEGPVTVLGGDEYYTSINEAVDHILDEVVWDEGDDWSPENCPRYLVTCTIDRVCDLHPGTQAECLIEMIADDRHEGAWDDLAAECSSLAEAIEPWLREQDVETWYPNYRMLIDMLPVWERERGEAGE